MGDSTMSKAGKQVAGWVTIVIILTLSLLHVIDLLMF